MVDSSRDDVRSVPFLRRAIIERLHFDRTQTEAGVVATGLDKARAELRVRQGVGGATMPARAGAGAQLGAARDRIFRAHPQRFGWPGLNLPSAVRASRRHIIAYIGLEGRLMAEMIGWSRAGHAGCFRRSDAHSGASYRKRDVAGARIAPPVRTFGNPSRCRVARPPRHNGMPSCDVPMKAQCGDPGHSPPQGLLHLERCLGFAGRGAVI